VTAPLYRAINNVARTREDTETARAEVELAA
jgi:hypothetical protein